MSGSTFICEFCGKEYLYRYSLRNHFVRDHPKEANDYIHPTRNNESSGSHRCHLCDKTFPHKYSLNRHKQRTHGERTSPGWKCMLCEFVTHSKHSWFHHFGIVHGIHVKYQDLLFSTEVDFFKWKQEIERTTRSKYVKTSGTRCIGGSSTWYFACHRSGKYISTGKGIRRLKSTGSVKINGKCPAEMRVLCKEGKYRVYFVPTHVGHEHLEQVNVNANVGHEHLEQVNVNTNVGQEILEKINVNANVGHEHLEQVSVNTNDGQEILEKINVNTNVGQEILEKINVNPNVGHDNLEQVNVNTNFGQEILERINVNANLGHENLGQVNVNANVGQELLEKVNVNANVGQGLLELVNVNANVTHDLWEQIDVNANVGQELLEQVNVNSNLGHDLWEQIIVNADSETPDSLSVEKHMIMAMFSDIIDGLTGSEIQLAKEMVTSLKEKVCTLRFHSNSFFRGHTRKLAPKSLLLSTKKAKSILRVPLRVTDAEGSNDILGKLLDEGLDSAHSLTLKEEIAMPWQQELQHSAPGPVVVPVEQYNDSSQQQQLQNNTPGFNIKQCIALEHSYANHGNY